MIKTFLHKILSVVASETPNLEPQIQRLWLDILEERPPTKKSCIRVIHFIELSQLSLNEKDVNISFIKDWLSKKEYNQRGYRREQNQEI